jgi:YhcN/YlaJ family sporulation lipoprotein
MKVVVLLAMLMWIVSGCGSKFGQSSSSAKPNHGQAGNVQVQQTAPEQQTAMTNDEIVQHLEQLAARVPDVESVHVVLFGNTAVVGVNVKPALDRAKVGTIKYSVAEALRKDPYGANAVVTADMDLDERIRKIRQEVKNGRPISGFADELGKIVGRIMPQLPRDVTPGANQPAPFDNSSVTPESGL